MAFVHIRELPSKTIAPGITLRSVFLDNLMVTFVDLVDGAVVPVHEHPHEQITVVISGELRFTLQGEERLMRAGDAITIPSGATHTAVAVNGPCVAYDSWNPVRRDYVIDSPGGHAEKKESCEFPDGNPPDAEIVRVLKNSATVAVVGLSDNPERDSFKVAKYLKEQGYTIIPVNPAKTEILGEKCYADIASIPVKIDVVDIFRQVEAVPGIVDEAIAAGAGAIWMQLGLAHRESAGRARAAGLTVIQSKCMKIEHLKLLKGERGDAPPETDFKLTI